MGNPHRLPTNKLLEVKIYEKAEILLYSPLSTFASAIMFSGTFLATYVFVYIVLVVFCRPYHRAAFQQVGHDVFVVPFTVAEIILSADDGAR